MSSNMQFQVFFGDYNVLYGPNGVDLSAFKCTSSAIDKPLERSFGSILVQIREKTQNEIQHGADQATLSIRRETNYVEQDESEQIENQNIEPQGLADERDDTKHRGGDGGRRPSRNGHGRR